MNDTKVNDIFGAPNESNNEDLDTNLDTSEEFDGNVQDTRIITTNDTKPIDNEQYIDGALKDVVDDIDDTLDRVKDLAELQESPRAYEVYSTMLKTKIDALERLAGIQKERNKVQPSTVNNTQVNIGNDAANATNINEILNRISAPDA